MAASIANSRNDADDIQPVITKSEKAVYESKKRRDVTLIPQPSNSAQDPLNWPLSKKYGTLFVVCFAAFGASTGPTSNQLIYVLQATQYARSDVELSYTITVAVAGLFLGPVVFVPLARVIGRSSLIFWSILAVLLCQIWGALMTAQSNYIPFLFSRLLAGMFAAVPTVLGPSIAVDIFFLHQRGKAFVSYELSLIGGIIVSPTIGGFIAESKPWPYALWWTIAPIGVALILVFCFLEETSFEREPSSETRQMLPKSFWRKRVATFFPGNKAVAPTTFNQVVKAATTPFIIAAAPNTIIVGFYIFVVFGFAVQTTILLTIVLQTPEAAGGYGFSPLRNAAFSFDTWAAILTGQVIGWSLGDTVPLWACRAFNHGLWRPEYRLWNILLPALVAPIGLGLFGACLQYHLHYMVLALAYFLITLSAYFAVPVCINYAVECYTTSVSEVAVAMNMYRLGFSIALGFFTFPWEAAVKGPGWLFGMAAFFDLFVAAVVGALIWKGSVLRKRFSPKGLVATEEGERILVRRHDGEGMATVTDVIVVESGS